MAGQLTMWGAGQIVSSFFSRVGQPPASFYLALIADVAPSPYVSGAELNEPQKDSYARIEIPNTSVHWSNASQPQIALTQADIPFVIATEDWGTIRYWALCNASVDGYVYAVGSLDTVLTVSTGDTAILSAGDLSISLGSFSSEES